MYTQPLPHDLLPTPFSPQIRHSLLRLLNRLLLLLRSILRLLLLRLHSLNSLPRLLLGDLLWASDGDVLGPVVTETPLETLLNDVAADVVDQHGRGHANLEVGGEWDKLHLLVELWDELGGAGESECRYTEDAEVHAPVLGEVLAEWTTLVVDCEGRDLLDQLQEVDGAVKQRWCEFALEVDILVTSGIVSMRCLARLGMATYGAMVSHRRAI